MVQQLTMVLSDFRFNDPDKDHELIRQHAAMSGKRDGLMQILAFDDAALREANDKLASAISPEDSPETLGG